MSSTNNTKSVETTNSNYYIRKIEIKLFMSKYGMTKYNLNKWRYISE